MSAWQNGELIGKPRVDALSAGFQHGFSIFESFRTYAGKCVALDWHLERLALGAERLGLADRWSEAECAAAVEAVSPGQGDARMRITLYEGPDGRDGVELLVTARRLAPLDPSWYARGYAVAVAPWEHALPGVLQGIKHGAYLGCALAHRWARAAGYDDALLQGGGHVIEASTANVFWARDGKLWTPPLSQDPLPGTQRRWLVERGFAHERALPCERLDDMDEAFLTNAVIGVMPLTRIGERPVGDGRPGSLTRAAARAFARRIADACGPDAAATVWAG